MKNRGEMYEKTHFILSTPGEKPCGTGEDGMEAGEPLPQGADSCAADLAAHRILADAVLFRRDAVGDQSRCGACELDLSRRGLLARVRPVRPCRAVQRAAASAGRRVGYGKLFCLELPRHAHPAVGLLRAGHRRSCRGQLSVCGDLGDGRGRHPARGARVEPAPSVR